jgi:hypothetical protein
MFKQRIRRILALHGIAAVLGAGVLVVATAATGDGSNRDLASVRGAVAKYHTTEAAEAGGWGLVPGLDHCFHSSAGGMGVHYIKGPLDTSLDARAPEALVYQFLPNGELHLGAVEYIVPADQWAAEGHAADDPPSVLGRDLHLNTDLGVWVLHAWIFDRNPSGVFEDFNPTVSCP